MPLSRTAMSWILLFCVPWPMQISLQVTASQAAAYYVRCQTTDGIFQTTSNRTLTSARRLGCFQQCTADPLCRSLNVCPQGTGRVNCELISAYSPWFCKQLSVSSGSKCFHAEKRSLECRNGGRLQSNGKCKCDVGFKGTNCTQRARDCQEAKELAAVNGGYNVPVVINIHPATSPIPFPVTCRFPGSLVTYLVLRVQDMSSGWSQIDWKTLSWDVYRLGLGSWAQLNLFIGLENMKHLLDQALYTLTVYTSGCPFTANYNNATLRGEDEHYALSFDYYTNNQNNNESVDNVNGYLGGHILYYFCTPNRDCGNNCSATNGPGWYHVTGEACEGYSPFAAIAQWPCVEDIRNPSQIEYTVARIGGFY